MKKWLFCLTLFILSFYSNAQLHQGVFAIGGPSQEQGSCIIQAKNGDYAIAGYTPSYGAGGYDFYILKLDNAGNLQWTKTIGGINNDEAESIIQTRDGGFAIIGTTGSFGTGGDVYVVKLDSLGNLKWTKTIGGSGADYGASIVQTMDDGFAITGTTNTHQPYLIRLDSAGNLKWTKTIISPAGYGGSIIQAKDGGFAITGYTVPTSTMSDVLIVKFDSTGNLQWLKTIGGLNNDYGESIIQSKDGNYVVTGTTASFGAGGDDVYVIKLDSTGSIKWTKTIGGKKNDDGYCIIQNKNGSYTIAAGTNSFADSLHGDTYIINLDSNGNLNWTKTIGGKSETDYCTSIVQTFDGGFALAGVTFSYGDGSSDIYFLKLDSLGNTCDTVGSGGMITSSDSGRVTLSGGTIGSGGAITSSDSGRVGSGGILTSVCNIITPTKNVKPPSDNFQLSPNPCTTTLNIDFETQPNLSSIQITDITGRVRLTYNLQLTTYDFPINISALAPGMYFIRINSISGTEVRKFIKE
jgi:hypothetical protein